MIKDEKGTLWLHTGDEASFTADGYCRITGRFKDIIIRGKFFSFFIQNKEKSKLMGEY